VLHTAVINIAQIQQLCTRARRALYSAALLLSNIHDPNVSVGQAVLCVCLCSQCADDGTIDVRLEHADDQRSITLTVADSGNGIPTDFKDRLFNTIGLTTTNTGVRVCTLCSKRVRLGAALHLCPFQVSCMCLVTGTKYRLHRWLRARTVHLQVQCGSPGRHHQ